MTNDLQGLKSSTNTWRIDKENKEEKELQSRTHWRVASRGHDSAIQQHTQAGRQKKERENNSETHLVIKRNIS
jgi:hypothetical protein